MNTVLVTGANGFLGDCLVNKLISLDNYQLFTLSRNKGQLKEKYQEAQLTHFDVEDFYQNRICFDKIDVVIHCAFARANEGTELAKSLDLAKDIFETALKSNCNMINISSRSVYGQNPDIPWTEDSIVCPDNLYALAKYSSELVLESCFKSSDLSKVTNIRLAGLVSPAFNDRIVNKFIDNTIKGLPINIVGGNQQFAYLDIKDAASGLIALLNKKGNWKSCYNLGSTKTYSIIEIASIVESVSKEFDIPKVVINITKSEAKLLADMDSSLYYTDTNWKPEYDMEAIVREIFNYKLNNVI